MIVVFAFHSTACFVELNKKFVYLLCDVSVN